MVKTLVVKTLGGEDLGGEDLGGEDLGDGGGGTLRCRLAGGIGLGTLGHNGMNWVADVGFGTQIAPIGRHAEGYILTAAKCWRKRSISDDWICTLDDFDPMVALMPDQDDGLGEGAVFGHTAGDQLDDGPITETLWLGDGGGVAERTIA